MTDQLTIAATDFARRHITALVPDNRWAQRAGQLAPMLAIEASSPGSNPANPTHPRPPTASPTPSRRHPSRSTRPRATHRPAQESGNQGTSGDLPGTQEAVTGAGATEANEPLATVTIRHPRFPRG